MTAIRLLWAGLHRRYRVFFAFLVFMVCRSGLLMACDVRGWWYARIWIVTEPVLWVFYVALVLELYSLILQSHKGLYTLGRWALYAALAIALALSLFSLAAPARDPFNQSRLIALLLVIERGLLLSVVLFLILMLAFLSRYPITLTRNVLIHSIVYSLFFLSYTLAFLIRSMLGYQVAKPVNLALSGVSALCALTWAVLLSPAGEHRPIRLRGVWSRSRERVLVEQLDSINAALLRAARK
ncbi:MAG: hypothetical protein ACE15B_12440 [Bryobacteraceae bacterium]